MMTSVQVYQSRSPVPQVELAAVHKQEEITTKKKRDQTVTKQIETRVRREVVITEDGEILEDTGPTVTTDIKEDSVLAENKTTEVKKSKPDSAVGDGWRLVPGSAVTTETTHNRTENHETFDEVTEAEEREDLGGGVQRDDLLRALQYRDQRALKKQDSGSSLNSSGYHTSSPTRFHTNIIHQSQDSHKTVDEEQTREVTSVAGERTNVETQRDKTHEEFTSADAPKTEEEEIRRQKKLTECNIVLNGNGSRPEVTGVDRLKQQLREKALNRIAHNTLLGVSIPESNPQVYTASVSPVPEIKLKNTDKWINSHFGSQDSLASSGVRSGNISVTMISNNGDSGHDSWSSTDKLNRYHYLKRQQVPTSPPPPPSFSPTLVSQLHSSAKTNDYHHTSPPSSPFDKSSIISINSSGKNTPTSPKQQYHFGENPMSPSLPKSPVTVSSYNGGRAGGSASSYSPVERKYPAVERSVPIKMYSERLPTIRTGIFRSDSNRSNSRPNVTKTYSSNSDTVNGYHSAKPDLWNAKPESSNLVSVVTTLRRPSKTHDLNNNNSKSPAYSSERSPELKYGSREATTTHYGKTISPNEHVIKITLKENGDDNNSRFIRSYHGDTDVNYNRSKPLNNRYAEHHKSTPSLIDNKKNLINDRHISFANGHTTPKQPFKPTNGYTDSYKSQSSFHLNRSLSPDPTKYQPGKQGSVGSPYHISRKTDFFDEPRTYYSSFNSPSPSSPPPLIRSGSDYPYSNFNPVKKTLYKRTETAPIRYVSRSPSPTRLGVKPPSPVHPRSNGSVSPGSTTSRTYSNRVVGPVHKTISGTVVTPGSTWSRVEVDSNNKVTKVSSNRREIERPNGLYDHLDFHKSKKPEAGQPAVNIKYYNGR